MLKVISALALFLLVLLQNSAYAARCEGQEGRIIFEDDFTDDAGGWVADRGPTWDADFGKSGLSLHVQSPTTWWVFSNLTFTTSEGDFCVEAVIPKTAAGTSPGSGLVFWAKDVQNFYALLIGPDGAVALWRKDAGNWGILLDWLKPKVKPEPGSVAALRAVVKANLITASVNGVEVKKLRAQRPEGNLKFGVYIYTVKEVPAPGVTFQFKRYKVTAGSDPLLRQDNTKPVTSLDVSQPYLLSTQFRGLDMQLHGSTEKSYLAERGAKWRLVPAGNGFYRLTTTLNGEVMCLDIWNSEKLEAHLGACANYSGQFWRISHVEGGARLSTQFRGEDFCLDVWSDTLQAHLAPCANYSGQLWLLAKVSEGAALGKMRTTKPLVPEEEKALKPKDAFKECDVCPEMIVVAAGSFTMGSPKNEPHRVDIEGPQHRVNFAKPFAVGKFEVTVDEFKAFANETGHDTISDCREDGLNGRRNLSWRDPGFPQSGAHPVTCLSWDDAKAYVLWLAKKTSAPYRLLR